MKKIKEKIKVIWEFLLFKSRYFIVLAIISTMMSSVFLFIWTMRNFTLFIKDWLYITEKEIIVNIVSWIDLFLLWVITLIVSFSLYEIYLKTETSKLKLPKSLVVNNLDDLKDKLTSVTLIILIITYFKYSINLTYTNSYELLAFAIGIFFISLSIYFSKNKKD